MQLINDYITIQKIRFEERLVFSMDIGDQYKNYNIPKLTFQPIVENSINYGLETMKGVCEIMIKIVEGIDYLQIDITDNGPGMSTDFVNKLENGEINPRGTGIGLKNINERIKIIFGERYGISIHSRENTGTTVSIQIPYESGDMDV